MGSLAPVIIGSRYGLKIDRDHLRGSGQSVDILSVFGTQLVKHFGIGLRIFHAPTAQSDRQFKAFLWSFCD